MTAKVAYYYRNRHDTAELACYCRSGVILPEWLIAAEVAYYCRSGLLVPRWLITAEVAY